MGWHRARRRGYPLWSTCRRATWRCASPALAPRRPATSRRRAIKRDLHDGARQQLTAILWKLSIVRERLAEASVAQAWIVELQRTLGELRRLAHASIQRGSPRSDSLERSKPSRNGQRVRSPSPASVSGAFAPSFDARVPDGRCSAFCERPRPRAAPSGLGSSRPLHAQAGRPVPARLRDRRRCRSTTAGAWSRPGRRPAVRRRPARAGRPRG
jgi:hypothetical protein